MEDECSPSGAIMTEGSGFIAPDLLARVPARLYQGRESCRCVCILLLSFGIEGRGRNSGMRWADTHSDTASRHAPHTHSGPSRVLQCRSDESLMSLLLHRSELDMEGSKSQSKLHPVAVIQVCPHNTHSSKIHIYKSIQDPYAIYCVYNKLKPGCYTTTNQQG